MNKRIKEYLNSMNNCGFINVKDVSNDNSPFVFKITVENGPIYTLHDNHIEYRYKNNVFSFFYSDVEDYKNYLKIQDYSNSDGTNLILLDIKIKKRTETMMLPVAIYSLFLRVLSELTKFS